MRRLAALLVLLAACGDDPVDVRKEEGSDYNRGALQDAIAKFIADGRTPQAYGVLAQQVLALRKGMDENVAELAELEMVTLAIDPVESVRGLPPNAQTDALAT